MNPVKRAPLVRALIDPTHPAPRSIAAGCRSLAVLQRSASRDVRQYPAPPASPWFEAGRALARAVSFLDACRRLGQPIRERRVQRPLRFETLAQALHWLLVDGARCRAQPDRPIVRRYA